MQITRLLQWLGVMTLAGYVLVGSTPFPNVLAARLMENFELTPADAIVVLGGNLNEDGELNPSSLKRAVRGMELYQSGYAPLLALLGSSAFDGRSEASVRRSLALTMQIPPGDIVTESRAPTTRDEARIMNEVLTPMGVRQILLVSDSQHLIRARILFENEGFEVFAAPADTLSPLSDYPLSRLKLMLWILREQAARLYYRAAGYL
jgi:uncharacterized SAM-binding protein YcdF (DUF218 family)